LNKPYAINQFKVKKLNSMHGFQQNNNLYFAH